MVQIYIFYEKTPNNFVDKSFCFIFVVLNKKIENMVDKWNKLRILIKWLEQGRELEIEDVKYGISEDGNILRMFSQDKGVELPTLSHVWDLIEKISDDKLFLMSSETALTNIKSESSKH